MGKDGLITRKDIIEDQALTIGTDYAKNMQPAIEANKQLVASLKEMAPLVNAFRKTDSQQAYLEIKQKENIITLQAINANKLLEASELSLEKIKQSKLKTEKEALNVQAKIESSKKTNTKLTIEERVQNEVNNRLLKQEARERLGLVSIYEKLNRSRLEAQKRLADLLSAEVKNNAEIRIAQREYDKLDARVKAVDAATKNYSKNIGNYGSAFEGLNTTVKDLIATFGLVTGLALLGIIVKDIFSIVKDFDRQLIAVGKTTNITGDELKQFGREVVDLGDRLDGITVDGLIQSAEVAGQLGVTGTSNILKFSEAIEKLKLTSNIISDEQVGQFAKFIEVSSDSFENADKLASVITQLGNSFATTEAEVLANATEIQKGIAVYNTSAQGVLALGAATSTLGSEAESSRSAVQSTFAVINNAIATGANLEKVLKLTGLTQKELSKQFNQDATGVFVKFVKGLSDAKKGGENLALVLNDVEITEKRAFTVIGSLAANYGILEQSMAQANKEYIDNAALNKEVAAASESIASIVGDLRDKWEAYVLQTNDANSGSEALTKTLKFLRDNFKDIINFVLKAGAVLFTYLGVVKAVNFVMAASTALQVAWTAGQIRFALATGIGTESILAQAAAARAAMVAQEGLNVAVKATPWGLILGFLSAAVVAYMVFNDQMSEADKNIQNIIDANKRLQDSEKGYAGERDKSRSDDFKAIEDDIKLRKAKGENSDKLDKEEIARKKEILQAQISVYSDLKGVELERTKTDISNSRQRIAQMETEQKILEKSGYRVSKQGRTSDDLAEMITTEKEKLNAKKASFSENSKLTVEEQTRLSKLMQDLDKDAAVKDAEFKAEADKKAIAARKKYLKELYDAKKKAIDDEFKLSQFRFQVAIDMDEEILKNDKGSLNDRVDALSEYQQLLTAKTKSAAEYELQQLGKYNEKTGQLIRELSNNEIKILLNEGMIKKKLTSEQLLILEKYQNEQTKLKQKGVEERQKIIDSQVDSMQKQLDKELLDQSTKIQKSLLLENEQYKTELQLAEDNYILLEKAKKDHEDRISKITSDAKKEQLLTEIEAIQKILDSEKSRTDGSAISIDKIKKLENELATYRKELSVENTNDTVKSTTERVELEKEAKDRIVDLQLQLKDSLIDLANTIFDARIQNIDNEITASNDYYDQQIELAGNDERQKSLLEKERAKKEKELQKEKQKEQVKAAIFNKIMSVATIAIQTAMAASAALAPPPIGLGPVLGGTLLPYIISLGAIQAATVLATPIPKYKMGRKGGPAEVAEVGDGGVHEVISRPDGSGARLTPNQPTLTFLQQDDVVHKSMADFHQYKRHSILKGFYKEKELASNFKMIGNTNDNSELINEMRLTRETIKKQKTNVQVINKIDFDYENYRRSNINWRK
jgi:hypothetical protein